MKSLLWWVGLVSFLLTGLAGHLDVLPVPDAWRGPIEIAAFVASLVMAYLRVPAAPSDPKAVQPRSEWPL